MTVSAACASSRSGSVPQQFSEPQQRAAGHGQGEFRVVDLEPAGVDGGLDVAQRARRQAAVRRQQRRPVGQQDLALLWALTEQPAGQPEAGGERLGGVVDRLGEPVQQRAVRVEHVGDRGLEQLLLAVEVVVEGTHPDVGGLGDLQDRHVELALGDQPLRRLDQRRPGALLAPLQAVDAAPLVRLVAHL